MTLFALDRRLQPRQSTDRRRRLRRPVRPGLPFVRLSMGMINRLVMVADMVIIVVAPLVLWCSGISGPQPLSWLQTLIAAALGAAVFGLVVHVWGGYRVERYRRPRPQATDIGLGLVAACVADRIMIWAFAPHVLASNAWLLTWLVWVAAGLALGRVAAGLAVQALRRRGLLRRRVAIVGATLLAGDIVRAVRQPQWHREFELAGLFCDAAIPPGRSPSSRNASVRDIADLRRLAQSTRIDLIVLALPWSQTERLFDLGERLQWISADVVVPLEQPGFLARSSVLTHVAGLPTLQLTRHPFRGTQGLVKMAQDVAIASLGLVVTSPVLLAAALAVRLSGPGPILFRQDRIGFNGRPFSIYKFRTMTVDVADDGRGGQHRDNARITGVGAFLRRTSIDELPQLLNVLRGEMSVVGPRPHVDGMRIDGHGHGDGDGHGSTYSDAVRSYAARHQIRPGITGWAQINGMRGGIDTLDKARRGVDLDLHYMRNWSLQLDVRIIIRTLALHMAGPRVF